MYLCNSVIIATTLIFISSTDFNCAKVNSCENWVWGVAESASQVRLCHFFFSSTHHHPHPFSLYPFYPLQELAKYFLAELLSEPNQTENDALEPEDLSQAAEQDEMRLELQRSANSNPAMAPRERKAGCKNFFWKTFTSC